MKDRGFSDCLAPITPRRAFFTAITLSLQFRMSDFFDISAKEQAPDSFVTALITASALRPYNHVISTSSFAQVYLEVAIAMLTTSG